MNEVRLQALSEFLADLSEPCIVVTGSRPMPGIGTSLFIRAILRFVTDQIGAGDADLIFSIFKEKLSRLPRTAEAMEKVWQDYPTDRQLHDYISTILAANGK